VGINYFKIFLIQLQGKFVIIANSFFYERTKQQKPWRTRVSSSVMNASHALRTILNEQKCIFLKWICNVLDYRSGKRMTLLKLFIDDCTMLECMFFSFCFVFLPFDYSLTFRHTSTFCFLIKMHDEIIGY